MKIKTLEKKDSNKIKVTDDFTKSIIDIIQEICTYKIKTDISDKIKELKIKEEDTNKRLDKYNRLLNESNNIEELIKKQSDKLVKENKEKIDKLIKILST